MNAGTIQVREYGPGARIRARCANTGQVREYGTAGALRPFRLAEASKTGIMIR